MAVVAPTVSAEYSGLCREARESVAVAEVVPARPVASRPSADAASPEIPVAGPCQAVAVASGLAGPAATAVCPLRAVVSVSVASGPAGAVDCCPPSTASAAVC